MVQPASDLARSLAAARSRPRLIAHPADRLNAARALIAPLLLFAPFVTDALAGYEPAYFLFLFMIIGDTNYLLHLHIHRPFGTGRALNRLLDVSMGAVTGMTASNWRIQHLYGHHRGIDEPYRGDTQAQLEDYSTRRALVFAVASLWATFSGPIVESFRKGVLADTRIPMNYRLAFCEQALFVAFVLGLLCWQPRLTLAYLMPWYAVIHVITRYVDYLNHYGCDEHSENVYARANNSLSWWFNRTTHNFGYHTAHHMRPGAHWTELPDIHRAIAGKIPQRHLKPFSWSSLLLPYHAYRSRRGRM